MREFNYVGLDISLSSTGLYILMKDGTEHYYNYINKNKLSKWHKKLSYINYESYTNLKSEDYSESEILKMLQYKGVTSKIYQDIIKHVNPEETIVITEGYSYSSSNTSSLIDLICFATLLRI